MVYNCIPFYVRAPEDCYAKLVTVAISQVTRLPYDQEVDKQHVIFLNGSQKVDLPLYYVLTQVREKQKVFASNMLTHM